MTKSIRQEARLKALEQLARRRADLAARETRIRAHVMAISTAASHHGLPPLRSP